MYKCENYSDYLGWHSLLHNLSRNTHLHKFVRLPSDTDIATLQAQIDELRNVVCSNAAR